MNTIDDLSSIFVDEFIVPGAPQGKARPRFTRQGHAYTPKKTHDYESYIKMCYKQKVKEKCYKEDEPLEISINAYYPIPKSYNKAKKQQAIAGALVPRSKPDVDNIAKAVLDALNLTAYEDDKLVAKLTVEKHYSEEPRLEIRIGALHER